MGSIVQAGVPEGSLGEVPAQEEAVRDEAGESAQIMDSTFIAAHLIITMVAGWGAEGLCQGAAEDGVGS